MSPQHWTSLSSTAQARGYPNLFHSKTLSYQVFGVWFTPTQFVLLMSPLKTNSLSNQKCAFVIFQLNLIRFCQRGVLVYRKYDARISGILVTLLDSKATEPTKRACHACGNKEKFGGQPIRQKKQRGSFYIGTFGKAGSPS